MEGLALPVTSSLRSASRPMMGTGHTEGRMGCQARPGRLQARIEASIN